MQAIDMVMSDSEVARLLSCCRDEAGFAAAVCTVSTCVCSQMSACRLTSQFKLPLLPCCCTIMHLCDLADGGLCFELTRYIYLRPWALPLLLSLWSHRMQRTRGWHPCRVLFGSFLLHNLSQEVMLHHDTFMPDCPLQARLTLLIRPHLGDWVKHTAGTRALHCSRYVLYML